MNRQLYENSGLKELFEGTPSAGGGSAPLFNAREPNLAILHEKGEHRLLLWLKAKGASNREIARESGYTEPWLSQLFRQPWAQAQLVEMLREAGADEVGAIIKGAAADSVFTLIELRDDSDMPGAVRKGAADSLLDRYLGKPHQSVEVRSEAKAIESVDDLNKELAELEQEEKRLLGRP